MGVERIGMLAVLVLVTACGADDKDTFGGGGTTAEADSGGGGGSASAGECVSGDWWTGGNSESPRMHPGMDCIACHEASNEGPRYTVAGTVHTGLDEPDDCNGVEGVTVEITDANGDVWTDDTNSAGNFFLRDGDIVFPITARIISDDGVREMATEVETGACASCHTADGEGGAPGRVMAP
jgi:cytochrome c553